MLKAPTVLIIQNDHITIIVAGKGGADFSHIWNSQLQKLSMWSHV